MALVRWDRLRGMTALQDEVNRIFSRAGGGAAAEQQPQTSMPSVDVVETQNAIKLGSAAAKRASQECR